MKAALVPLNPTVGDVEGNSALIESAVMAHRDADLVVLPELCISGYPPRDLLLHGAFIDRCEHAADRLASGLPKGPAVVIGAPLRHAERADAITNSLIVLSNGRRAARYDKRLLPNYDVFDEVRYFEQGSQPVVVEVAGERIGLSVCEDLWGGVDAGAQNRYAGRADPIGELVAAGATTIVNPSASPFVAGKYGHHRSIVASYASRHGVAVLSVNQHGANDDLIFDGAALANRGGSPIAENTRWSGEALVLDTSAASETEQVPPHEARELIEALTLGVRDYARKSGFASACLGLSGGIDSAVTAAIAARALGGSHVLGVAMPSKYSSQHSIDDAHDLARRLGCSCQDAPIGGPFEGFRGTIDPLFERMGQRPLAQSRPDLTEENLQSRVRGTMMMAVSNRTGALLLTTGNKSEIAVGYSTLYGDMNGGLAVLSDLYKRDVYAIAKLMNDQFAELGFSTPPIPESTIDKPPSAELAPDQKDEDSLPPYDTLDEIVRRKIEGRESASEIVRSTGFDAALVRRICRLIDINEYKRKQLAVGLKVSRVAFGRGRRMPLVMAPRDDVAG
ncbi:MAG: NAD+ synthase [Planctomycetota bacterium]